MGQSVLEHHESIVGAVEEVDRFVDGQGGWCEVAALQTLNARIDRTGRRELNRTPALGTRAAVLNSANEASFLSDAP